jgi:hypothetical protein
VHNACVACAVNTDCGAAAPVCDTCQGQCVGCVSDTDCKTTAAPHCDPQNNTCVQCVTGAQCPMAMPNCFQGTCHP